MIIDAWDPQTFSAEIATVLTKHSELIFDYHVEDRRLMHEHLNSSPYQSLKPNRLFRAHQNFRENTLAPIVAKSRIRVWHYTRLTDEEANTMCSKIVPSSLEYLRYRLSNLVANNLLTKDDAETVFAQSPYHRQPFRTNSLWTTVLPLSHCDCGVELLLKYWGGESAYFWLSDERIVNTLRNLGTSRIVEIETALMDELNGYSVAGIFLAAWARQLGAPVTPSNRDLLIREFIDTAKVIRIHTKGDNFFEAVGTTYPVGASTLLEDDNGSTI